MPWCVPRVIISPGGERSPSLRRQRLDMQPELLFGPAGQVGPEDISVPGCPEEPLFVGHRRGPGMERLQRHPQSQPARVDGQDALVRREVGAGQGRGQCPDHDALGTATVSNGLVFTTLYSGVLIALNRAAGEVVYRRQLPTSANSPIAVFGNTVLVPAGGPKTSSSGGGGHPQLVAYTVPASR